MQWVQWTINGMFSMGKLRVTLPVIQEPRRVLLDDLVEERVRNVDGVLNVHKDALRSHLDVLGSQVQLRPLFWHQFGL